MNFNTVLIDEAINAIENTGAFLVSGNNPPDVMAMTWGAIGVFWNKPVLIAPVRYSRFTYDLVDQNHEFAISIPRKDMRTELMRCGEISGRDYNKFEELQLHPTKCRSLDTYIVSDCGLHLECRVIYKAGMETFQLIDEKVKHDFYLNHNFHSMFFAEIVELYET